MGVLVALFPLQSGGIGVNILQLPGHVAPPARLHIRPRGHDTGADAVGLGGRGKQDGGLCQGELCLRQAKLHGGIHAGLYNGDGLGIGEAHILTGGAQQPAAGGDEIPGLQKAGQIVQRRVRVAAPDGLVESGGGIIHGIAAPVIPHGAALGQRLGIRLRQQQRSVFGDRRLAEQLHGVDGLPHIAAAALSHQRRDLRLPRQGQGRPGLHDLQGPKHCRADLLRRDGFELKHTAAGKQRVVHIEKRIFRGGSDEGQGSVLHKFQQALLLLFVEILDLIQIQQDAAGGQQRPHIRDDVLHVLQGRRGGVQAVQRLVGLFRDDVGHGGLAGAGGAVEHHVGVSPGIDQAAQNTAGRQQVPLTHDFIQSFRTDLVR